METLSVNVKEPIPNKLFFKIGEVSHITQLEPYVLRYWESEFNFKLNKTNHKQRLYQRKDIDQILLVKTLLYDEKFTIAGAKKRIKEIKKKQRQNQLSLIYENKTSPKPPEKKLMAAKINQKSSSTVIAIKRELNAILDELKQF